jgi:aminopeptidase N
MKKSINFLILFFFYSYVSAQFTNSYQREKEFHSHNRQTTQIINKSSVSLMDKYDVKFYKIDIKAERTSVFVGGNVLIMAKVLSAPLDTFVFELKDYFIIDSVKVNNQKYLFQRTGDYVSIGLNPLSPYSEVNVQIFYYGMPPNTGNFFSGISCQTSPNWGNQITWTLSEPFAAKEWFPVKQSLTDKADSAYIFVTTNNDNKVGSNGLLTATIPLPNNKVRYEWKTRYPIAYYLLSFSVGKYIDYSIYAHPAGLQDSILIQNYIYNNPSTLTTFKSQIDTTIDFIELYSDLFGMYPFYKEKYGHCMAPLGGGMEHQTMTTLGNFNFYLNCHELSHQWWGNNVTCATWSDIWINEGFASYGEYLAASNLAGMQEAQQHMLDMHNNIMSSPDGSVYIPPYQAVDENRIFDGRLSYKKGAAIIHNLRFEIGNDTTFFNILKQIQIRYKDSTLTGMDFKAVAEELTGKDFTDFFNQWYVGEGFPTFNILYWKQNDTLFIKSTESTSSNITPLFKMQMEYKIQSSLGDTNIKLYQTTNVQTFKIPLFRPVSGIVVDPNNWVVNGNGSVIMGIENSIDNINFTISPNPCNDFLEIYRNDHKMSNTFLSVFDITGKIVLSEKLFLKEKLQIKTDHIEKGIYFIQISDGVNRTIQKFVKQ